MKISILTAGTRGDTQPYVALGIGLQKAGHQVRVAGGSSFASFVQQFGLEFSPLGIDISAMMNSELVQSIMETNNPIKMLMAQAQALKDNSEITAKMQNEIWDIVQGSDAVLFSPGVLGGYYAAHFLGIPAIGINAVPMSATSDHPAALFYDGPRLGKTYNRLTHFIQAQAFWQALRPALQTYWKQKSNQVTIPFWAPYGELRANHLPILYGISEHAFPRPSDWPDYERVTGYWFIDDEPAWTPSPALQDFLQSGPPPVYIGFGSMGNTRRARETTELILTALKQSGQRGLLATGWNGLSQDFPLPETVFMLESAPHSWLFPQVSAVVHHGGAGTTAAGLRAGVPSIIIPQAVDQPMWGRRVMELGVGSKPIPRKKLTAEALTQAILATQDKTMRAKASALGEKIRAENGVSRAVEAIEAILNHR